MATASKRLFEEFIVDTKQVSQITHAKSKIERMHEVQITLKEIVKQERKQWIKIEGDVRDRMNAREYIIAMCHPEETFELPVEDRSKEYLSDESLEETEKQTNAFIEWIENNKIIIKGAELAVTLAVSSLENIIEQSNIIETDGADGSSKPTQKDPDSSLWEKRLDSTFLRALSSNSDGACKYENYHKTSKEVKMAILKCLNNDNVDDNDLFDGSKNKDDAIGMSEGFPIRIYGDDSFTEPPIVLDDSIIEQEVKDNEKTPERTESKEVQFLRSFGKNASYSDEIIEKGLMYVDDKTAPCDFLDILKQLQESSRSKSGEPMEVDEPVIASTSFPPPPVVSSEDFERARRSLPKEYKDTLIQHVREEEKGSMSRDDLMKQNEERQKILKEQFITSSPQNSPRKEGSGKKKKKRKKNKNKVGQNNNVIDGTSKDVRDGFDEEETHVLKTIDSSESDDCVITEVEDRTVPVLRVQPSPRNSQGYVPSSSRSPPKANFVPPSPRSIINSNNCPPTQRQPYGHSDYSYDRNNYNVNPRGQNCTEPKGPRELRYIVIDGSNVAMQHGRGKFFSCKGIQLCVDYFHNRGHTKIMCFVPAWRKYRPRPQNPITDQEILTELNEKGLLEFTPARRLENKLISSYDDRYVVELCETVDGIIVSNDQYRDLMCEKNSWKRIIEARLLQYNFVGDIFMVPGDPLGKDGPPLDEFLSKPSKQPSPMRGRNQAPYNPSYQGNTYNRPAPNQPYKPSILGVPPANLASQPPPLMGLPSHWQNPSTSGSNYQGQQQQTRPAWINQGGQNLFQGQGQNHLQGQIFQNQGQNQGQRFPSQNRYSKSPQKRPQRPPRTAKETEQLVNELKDIFPDSEKKITEVVEHHPWETNLTKLSNYIINALS